MLQTIYVERFKSLVKLKLDLGRVNVFIGANGSGKSNLLEAVGVLGAAAFGRVDDETLLRRGVRPGVPRLYKTAFPETSASPHIKFGAQSTEGAEYHVTLWNPLNSPGPAWRFKTENLQDKDGRIVSRGTTTAGKHNQEQGLAALKMVDLVPKMPTYELMQDLRNFAIHCPNTPALRGLTQDLQAREPVGLAGGRLPEAVDELIETARKDPILAEHLDGVREVIDWARDFSARPSVGLPLSPSAARSRLVVEFVDRFMARGRNKLSGYDASEGALYILYTAALALHPKAPRCLAVDNLDQALNPRLARQLMTSLCSWTKPRDTNGKRRPAWSSGSPAWVRDGQQWLLTVHNPAVLDGLSLDDPEVRLFAVDRNNRGHTVIRRIDLDTARKRRPDKHWTLSRMWMSGLLGGVPDV